MNASRDRNKVNQKLTTILHRLETIEKQQDKVVADLRQYLNDRVEDAVQQLSEYLSSEEVRVRFTTWCVDQIPNPRVFSVKTGYLINKVLSHHMRGIIEEWEEDNKVFTNACHDLIQHFQERYNFVEGQLRNFQVAVTSDGFMEKVKSFAEGALCVFLCIFVIGAQMTRLLGAQSTSLTNDYTCADMAVISADFLAAAAQRDKLKFLVREQLKQAELCLKQIESRIPELIRADKMLYEELTAQTRTEKEIQDLYRPIMNGGSSFRGQLLVFGIKEVCSPDISYEEMEWKEEEPSRLGYGAFGAVYQGTLRKRGDAKTVALKVFSNVLDAQNACTLMEEVDNLR